MLATKRVPTNLREQKLYQAFFFSNYNGMKLEINYRKKNGKEQTLNNNKINSMLLKKPMVNEEIKEEIRN